MHAATALSHDGLLLGLLFALIIVSGFFSSSETSMMALNRYRLRHLARKNHRVAKRVLLLLRRPDRLLGSILIGNTFANILASSIATVLAARWFGELGIFISTIALTLLILIFAEIAPKTVAALYAERVAFLVSLPLKILLWVFYPLVWLANGVANGLLRLCGIRVHAGNNDSLSKDELHSVVREAGNRISSEHRNMLLGIFDLEKVTVEDIMVPRNEITGIDVNDEWDEIMEQLTNSQHTRLPVYADDIEQVQGVLHVRTALKLSATDQLNKTSLLEHLEEGYFIPETTPLNRQLLNFRNRKSRLGFVVDEYGELQGLVTLEDILEEIVGEFTTDWADTWQAIHPQEDGSYLVDGAITLRELNRAHDWKFPEDGPKTLSGLIIEALQTIPTAHTSIRIAGYPVEVVQVKDNRVKTARLRAMPN